MLEGGRWIQDGAALHGRRRHVLLCGLVAAWVCSIPELQAQQPADTLLLPAVEITAPRLATYAAGTKLQILDSATLARHATVDLGELLANETAVAIKSYGLGSLATTSFRGGSANHMAILWNGINLGSPMNGQVDLALIPVGATDEVSVQYGGSTALWGSGALGGSVHLNSKPRFGQGLLLEAGAGIGSFGLHRQHVHAELGQDRWSTGLTYYNTHAENDFRFNGGTVVAPREQRQTNAAFGQYGLLWDQHVKVGTADRITVHYWHQRSDRQVPPTLAQAVGTASQEDGSDRVMAEWRHNRHAWGSAVRAAWMEEQLDWYADQDALAAKSRSTMVIAEAELRWRPGGPHTVDLGANFTRAEARSDGYLDGIGQDRSALFALYRFQRHGGRFTGTASARQEWSAAGTVPFTAALGGEYRVKSWVTLKAQAARLYRVPSFNDLYWQPGGDPGLLPEQGYSGDLGVVLRCGRNAVDLRSELTWFNRLVDNWIIWLPGPQWWSPSNILQVWSRGVETHSQLGFTVRRTTLKLTVGTSYVQSTNQVAKSRFDDSVGKQLIYVPLYSGNTTIGMEHSRASLSASAVYTGYRYTSTDNRDFLPPVWLLNAGAGYIAALRHQWQAEVFLRVQNLLGAEYQLVVNRPMPLCSVQAGVNVRFHRRTGTNNTTP